MAEERRTAATLVRRTTQERLTALLEERRQAEEELSDAAGRREAAVSALYRLQGAAERIALRREAAGGLEERSGRGTGRAHSGEQRRERRDGSGVADGSAPSRRRGTRRSPDERHRGRARPARACAPVRFRAANRRRRRGAARRTEEGTAGGRGCAGRGGGAQRRGGRRSDRACGYARAPRAYGASRSPRWARAWRATCARRVRSRRAEARHRPIWNGSRTRLPWRPGLPRPSVTISPSVHERPVTACSLSSG